MLYIVAVLLACLLAYVCVTGVARVTVPTKDPTKLTLRELMVGYQQSLDAHENRWSRWWSSWLCRPAHVRHEINMLQEQLRDLRQLPNDMLDVPLLDLDPHKLPCWVREIMAKIDAEAVS